MESIQLNSWLKFVYRIYEPLNFAENEMESINLGVVPNHISDEVALEIVHLHEDNELSVNYIPSCGVFHCSLGLILKCRKVLKRLIKRRREGNKVSSFTERLYILALTLSNRAEVLSKWDPIALDKAAFLIEEKCRVLSGYLINDFDHEPLFPPAPEAEGMLCFRESFVNKVRLYHDGLERPAVESVVEDVEVGTLLQDDAGIFSDPLLSSLSTIARDICPLCDGHRQIYCGKCGGVRMQNTVGVLPNRIHLPFDLLLILHWQETLHKCTGIHSRVLVDEGSVDWVNWEKEKWHGVAEGLDAGRDILLYPSSDAVDISEFNWFGGDLASNALPRFRVAVLEASWNYSQGMVSQIMDHRKQKGLPPILCVKFSKLVGKYWKFHEKGHSAVSTIESIAFVVKTVNELCRSKFVVDNTTYSESTWWDLLLLFRLQRLRMLSNVEHGAKPPRAMSVRGFGDSSWCNVTVVHGV